METGKGSKRQQPEQRAENKQPCPVKKLYVLSIAIFIILLPKPARTF